VTVYGGRLGAIEHSIGGLDALLHFEQLEKIRGAQLDNAFALPYNEDQSYMMAGGWYDRALSHGLSDMEAEEHLGVLLANGLGVTQNTERAEQLLEHSHNDDLVVLVKHNKLPRHLMPA
jgi:hypothetical protein